MTVHTPESVTPRLASASSTSAYADASPLMRKCDDEVSIIQSLSWMVAVKITVFVFGETISSDLIDQLTRIDLANAASDSGLHFKVVQPAITVTLILLN
jgi:hypothetical protein